MNTKINSLFWIFIFFWSANLLAQGLMQQTISIRFDGIEKKEALKRINDLEDIKLSYNPDVIPEGVVSGNFEGSSIDLVLKGVLGYGYDFKVRGSYIIVQKSEELQAKKKIQFSGAITDAETGESIPAVTIYEVTNLDATLTDKQGNFDLTVSSKTDYVTFAISQENYMDTLIMVKDVGELSGDIKLRKRPKKDTTISQRISIETKKMVKFFTTFETRQNVRNVSLEEERPFQFSLVPMVGTNGKLSGQVTNRISINLFAGYAKGFNGVELGGLYNIDREDISGFQAAGFGNAVGGTTHGAQLAGFVNTNRGFTSGFQAAGFVNLVGDQVVGTQMAGFVNINLKDSEGAQFAGFVNMVNGKVGGLQAAGFVNLAWEGHGAQMAGFTNVLTEESSGFQAAGFTNVARKFKGAQLSGFVNVSGDMQGFQGAGFVNVANNLKGVQLGIVNVADTLERGVPIGLINIIRNGKIEFGLEHNDFMDASFTFRSGINSFYTVLTTGIQTSGDLLYAYGLGLGTEFTLYKSLFSNLELTAHSINKDEFEGESLNLLNRLNWNFGYRFGKHLSINAGPALNFYITDWVNPETGELGFDWGQSPFHEKVDADLKMSLWVGYAASIRF